jgi:signal transduction histidine kinase/CheY-like chemotaxis protein
MHENSCLPAAENRMTRVTHPGIADLLAFARTLDLEAEVGAALEEIRSSAVSRTTLAPIDDDVCPELFEAVEHRLAERFGAPGAHLLLDCFRQQRSEIGVNELVAVLDKTSSAIHHSRNLMRATLEHLSQGVSVVDKNQRLVAWNRRYIELFQYPPGLITLGRPIGDLVRFNASRGLMGPGEAEEHVRRRLEHMRNGNPHSHEREMPDGTVIEIRGNPMPGGGFATSYSDVTAYKHAQRELLEINQTLESRVDERTAELTAANLALYEANIAAQRANQAKTRFLASASHDLVQPLNAARLFVASIDRHIVPEPVARLMAQVENSLTAAESLLGALLDISRLDAAAQTMKSEDLALSSVMGPLAAEFAALARARGLDFHVVPSRTVVRTDPSLLRRVVQNFLSNAVRYTRSGRILFGCRRLPGAVRIEVWDTGPGIPDEQHQLIFEEFRRLGGNDTADAGLGLGLAIAQRLARLMGHPIGLRSLPGRGSVFSITVPIGDPEAVAKPQAVRRSTDRVAGALVLCLDNEPAILEALQALLGGWGCEVVTARDGAEVATAWKSPARIPDLALIDYHLDGGADGIRVMESLADLWPMPIPGIVLTADHTREALAAAEAHGYELLQKPVKPAALRALMGRVLTLNRARRPERHAG